VQDSQLLPFIVAVAGAAVLLLWFVRLVRTGLDVAPRIHAELRSEGTRVSRKTVAKLMKQNGISPPRRKKRKPVTTDSNHRYGIAPNLVERQFNITRPNTVWLADITCVGAAEGWLYVAAIKNMAICEIVGWSMDTSLHSTLAERALIMALQRHDICQVISRSSGKLRS